MACIIIKANNCGRLGHIHGGGVGNRPVHTRSHSKQITFIPDHVHIRQDTSHNKDPIDGGYKRLLPRVLVSMDP